MKKILTLAFIAAMTIALSFAFTSCSSDDEPPIEKSLLTGKWYVSNEKGFYYEDGERKNYDDSYTKETTWLTWDVSADGTLITKEFNGDDIYENSFTWTLSGNKLNTKYSNGKTNVLIIKELTSTSLIFEGKGTNEDGAYEGITTFTKTN